MSLSLLASFLARPAADRERQGPQPSFGNRASAFETGAVLVGVEPNERFIDAGERLRPHLEQGQLDILLNVGVRTFEVITYLLRSVRAPVANATLNVVLL